MYSIVYVLQVHIHIYVHVYNMLYIYVLLPLQRKSICTKDHDHDHSVENGLLKEPDVPLPQRPQPGLIPPNSGKVVTLDDFVFLKVLGRGSFGKVLIEYHHVTFYYEFTLMYHMIIM